MKFAKPAHWVFSGLMLIVSAGYAQEGSQKTPRPADEATSPKSAASDARDKPLRDAEALMKAGRPADAYNLLEPLEFDRSGEVRFDYLIGIAALDSGKPDKATLAFERVLAVDPNFAGARLDMARAYFQLGDLLRAKTEFETVSKQNPPETARATIQKYLDAIAAQQAIKRTRFSAYAEAGLGYDNNVNNSTNQSQIAVPSFPNQTFTLSPTNLQTADNYYGVAAGGEINHNLNAQWGLYAGADVRQRGNFTQTRFDTLSLNGREGVTLTTNGGENIFRLGEWQEQYDLSRKYNRNSYGYNADWRHVYSPANQVSLFWLRGYNRFIDPAMKVNDFDQDTYGAGWLHALADGKSMLFGILFLTDENDVAPASNANPSGGRIDGKKRILGLRAGGQTAMRENLELFANFGLQSGVYGKDNVLFLRKRSDFQYDLSAGVNWHRDKDWTLRPQLNYSRNDSNIVIYKYDRIDASLTIRRDFR